MTRNPLSIVQRIEIFERRGWCPVRWAHHPQIIKDLIRKERFRPKMKACFENCQRLIVASLHHGGSDRIVYCEGWVQCVIPIDHAWLEVDGAIVDLTLDDVESYGEHHKLAPAEVVRRLVRIGVYGNLVDVYTFGPYAMALKQLQGEQP